MEYTGLCSGNTLNSHLSGYKFEFKPRTYIVKLLSLACRCWAVFSAES